MTLGKREYTEAEIMRMQRDAEERVREMQNRARQTVEFDNTAGTGQQTRNRNWNSGSGMRRPNNRRPQYGHPPPPEPPPEPPREEEKPPEPQPEPQEEKSTTVIEDIMRALNIDEDYLLIVGLILILLNQRADTTLILALAYLLI